MPGQEPQHHADLPKGHKWDHVRAIIARMLGTPHQPIPISEAEAIATAYGYHGCIIVGLNFSEENGMHVTTYGATQKLCKLFASLGDQVAERMLDGTIEPPAEEPK